MEWVVFETDVVNVSLGFNLTYFCILILYSPLLAIFQDVVERNLGALVEEMLIQI